MRTRASCLSLALLSSGACTIIEVVSEGEGSESGTELTGEASSESGAALSACEGPLAPAGQRARVLFSHRPSSRSGKSRFYL